MKNLKKILALVMVVAMMAALGVCAFAQDVATGAGGFATITISNAAKGAKYSVYKLFDAKATNDDDSAFVYEKMSGKEDVGNYFEVRANGDVIAKSTTTDDVVGSDEFETWAKSYGVAVKTDVVSDGTALVFSGLSYGYYFVTSTQENGDTTDAGITVTSANPSATITDKNTTTPLTVPTKVVNDTDVYIGEIVTYTLKVRTASYAGDDIITNYYIKDTLPAGVTFGEVTAFVISTTDLTIADNAAVDLSTLTNQYTGTKPSFTNGEMTIAWADGDSNLYTTGSFIYVQYTATVNENATLGTTGNTNTMQYTYDHRPIGNTDTPTNVPYSETYSDTATVYTYAAAIQKTDADHANLAGATFAVNGLTVSGTPGSYIVTAYDETSTTLGTVMECDANGKLVIIGVPSSDLSVAEVDAPVGYNPLTTPATVHPALIATSTTITKTVKYFDADGNETGKDTDTAVDAWSVEEVPAENWNEIQNFSGSVLPSTGGIGTTIFYVIGGILVVGAGVLLVTKKRMATKE